MLKQYKREKQLLESYKDICKFDINDLEKGPSESFLHAQASKSDEKISETVYDTAIIDETDLAELDQAALPDLDELNSLNEDNNLMELDNFSIPWKSDK